MSVPRSEFDHISPLGSAARHDPTRARHSMVRFERAEGLQDVPEPHKGFDAAGPYQLVTSQAGVRYVPFSLGILALAVAWIGPVPHYSETAFFAHMTMHMLNVAVAAPLLAIGLAGSRVDPVPSVPWLFAVLPASVAELIIVWAWHAPRPHHFAREYVVGLIAEQGSFILVGLWVWLSAFGGTRPRTRERSGAGVVGLLITSMHMTFLGALLALAPRTVYSHHSGFGSLSPLEDQHLGGAVMLVVGGAAYLLGGLWLAKDLVRSTTPRCGEG